MVGLRCRAAVRDEHIAACLALLPPFARLRQPMPAYASTPPGGYMCRALWRRTAVGKAKQGMQSESRFAFFRFRLRCGLGVLASHGGKKNSKTKGNRPKTDSNRLKNLTMLLGLTIHSGCARLCVCWQVTLPAVAFENHCLSVFIHGLKSLRKTI